MRNFRKPTVFTSGVQLPVVIPTTFHYSCNCRDFNFQKHSQSYKYFQMCRCVCMCGAHVCCCTCVKRGRQEQGERKSCAFGDCVCVSSQRIPLLQWTSQAHQRILGTRMGSALCMGVLPGWSLAPLVLSCSSHLFLGTASCADAAAPRYLANRCMLIPPPGKSTHLFNGSSSPRAQLHSRFFEEALPSHPAPLILGIAGSAPSPSWSQDSSVARSTGSGIRNAWNWILLQPFSLPLEPWEMNTCGTEFPCG